MTDSPVASTLPLSNLFVEDIAKVARWTKTDRSKTWFAFDVPSDGLVDNNAIVEAIALVNHNLPRGAQWRATISTEIPIQYMAPTAIEASSNFTSPLVSQINSDPDSTASLSAGHTVTTVGNGGSVRYSFATPTYDPVTGYVRQQFRVRVGYVGTPNGDERVTIQLYEGGVLKSTILSNYPITASQSAGGQEISAFWDASSLSDPTGAGVELNVICSAGTASTTVMAAAWYADATDVFLRDTGWLEAYPVTYRPDRYGLPGNVMAEFEQTVLNETIFRTVWVGVWADAEDVNKLPVQKVLDPVTAVDAGRLLLGDSIVPSTYGFGHAIDTNIELKDETEIVRTRDGQTRALQRARYLQHDIRLPGLTRSEKNGILRDLAAIGHGGELCMYVDTVETGFYENIYGRFSDLSMRALAPELWEMSFRLEQRVSDDGA